MGLIDFVQYGLENDFMFRLVFFGSIILGIGLVFVIFYINPKLERK